MHLNTTIFTTIFLLCMMPILANSEESIRYPYQANADRIKLIKSQYTQIIVGDTINEVLKKLPHPDEILDLCEPKIYKPKIIGKTYWYLIQRLAETGSVDEKDEKLVRVSADLQGIVTRIDHWGFD